jgi:predicted HAD superfamily phosphohydrolase
VFDRRLNKQVPEVVEHVVEHLTKLTGAKVRVRLEVEADVADGVPSKTVMDRECADVEVLGLRVRGGVVVAFSGDQRGPVASSWT